MLCFNYSLVFLVVAVMPQSLVLADRGSAAGIAQFLFLRLSCAGLDSSFAFTGRRSLLNPIHSGSALCKIQGHCGVAGRAPALCRHGSNAVPSY